MDLMPSLSIALLCCCALGAGPTTREAPTSRPGYTIAALATPDLSTPQLAWLEMKLALDSGDLRRFIQVTSVTEEVRRWALATADMNESARTLRQELIAKFGLDAMRAIRGLPGDDGVFTRAIAARDAREQLTKLK